MSRQRFTVAKGLFLATGVLAAALGTYGSKLIQEADATRGWPTVQGTIITAEIRPGDSESTARPLVRFEYTAGGIVYHSEQYRRGAAGQTIHKAAALEMVEKYPRGGQVPVHYDPFNPGNAVLEVGDVTLGYMICSAAFLLLVVAAILVLYARKRMRS